MSIPDNDPMPVFVIKAKDALAIGAINAYGLECHWKNPVIYMSRATTREVWHLLYGTEPDLSGDLRFGQSQIPVLFDDRLPLGEARLEEDIPIIDCPHCQSRHGGRYLCDPARTLLDESHGLRELFDLQWTRMGRATELWRAESPAERALVMPDLGHLLDWLIERGDSLLQLVDDLADPDPCELDHHGYCQAHSWMATKSRCPHARATEVLEERRATGA